MKVKVKNISGFELPHYETSGSAGLDIRSTESLMLEPGQRALLATGLFLEIPVGFEAQIRPRSGLAIKFGITMVNSPGTIDCDYRGEIKVILINHGQENFLIDRGDRIAQMVFAPILQISWEPVSTLNESDRGADGFGSTGRA